MKVKEKLENIDWKLLAGSMSLPYFAGLIGTLFTRSTVNTWYPALEKPFYTPPNWVFGPVWTLLYTLMGVSLYLVLQKGWERKDVRKAFYLFLAQLVLNAAWSGAFFTMKSPMAGMIVILGLLGVLPATIHQFWKVSETAAYLLVPYWLWTVFAALLNYGVLRLN